MKQQFPNLEQCDPRQCIASKIMKINRIITSIFRKHLKQFGITNSQLSILFLLSKRENVTQNELSNTLYLEKSTVSRNMRRLFDNELVDKIHFPQLHITVKGKQLLELVIPFWDIAMAETKSILTVNGEVSLNQLYNTITNQEL